MIGSIVLATYFFTTLGVLAISWGVFGMYYGKLWTRLRSLPMTKLKGLTARAFGALYFIGGLHLLLSGVLIQYNRNQGVLVGFVGTVLITIAAFVGYFSGHPVQKG